MTYKKMMKQNLVIFLFSTLALSACAKSTETSTKAAQPSAELQQKIQKLVEKTKKNMIFVEGGSFMMGDFGHVTRKDKLPITGLYAAMPLHKVTLDSFSLNAYKTTFDDFDIYTEATGQQKISTQKVSKFFRQENSPAGVSWQQAHDYCQWLGQQVGIPMTLPTEAQWEYAARNRGQYVIYPTDNGEYEPGRNVWSDEQRQKVKKTVGVDMPIPILGRFPPTPLGFYDMATDGNEWVSDWFDPQYYKHSPEKNPQGPATGTLKSVRSTYQEAGVIDLKIGGSVTTIYRSGENPEPKVDESDKDYLNPNDMTAVRCASNSSKPFISNKES
ncbi:MULTISPECIES: formylglycine-generating enzyme family protein [Acinetobacter]|uniref:SUMF1/EgtB/PvdO family nonheme iron enzyme n=3 Tax=Acinetobacter TaxID=469 RepID=A0AB38YZM6_9GAMM|nr:MULTISPECIES: SUMF1/EgtB/PvdO family nonheme iron enzyme [Acinetobacter]KOR14624.1 sulfatase [Acinetobacter sp. C15]MDQ8943495.1 SUMF1/EgtB/PvdO family nonheme iron enzyme [Acinetobacter soli]WEH92054.1 SUMF1/EgtB/PvdO family nonheme iron enzyme [Acinetobacter soli]WEH98804.1 SUMF1/EgtB/PvdO family nonheme iron enzyme [Acinetobacter soli]WEI00602.1 SUMF1/EgtB/PvdO family nonheme iron enzyme [Acinetobacter soli]